MTDEGSTFTPAPANGWNVIGPSWFLIGSSGMLPLLWVFVSMIDKIEALAASVSLSTE